MKIDMHTHSSYSDGELNLIEIFDIAEKSGLTHLAITDHDDISSFDFDNKTSVKHIFGVELSTVHEGESVHVLAYFKNKSSLSKEFIDLLRSMKSNRKVRMLKYIDNLNHYYNLNINKSSFENSDKLLARPHLAKIISKTTNLNIEQVFEKYLLEDNIAYVESTKLTTIDAVKILNTMSCFIVLAHPCILKDSTLIDLLDLSIFNGIEVRHPKNKDLDEESLRDLAINYNLFKTAGSDFHRLNDSSHANIGTCSFENHEALELLETLELHWKKEI